MFKGFESLFQGFSSLIRLRNANPNIRTNITTITNAIGIQIGLSTHNQLQSITPVNFKTRNVMNKAVVSDMFIFAIRIAF